MTKPTAAAATSKMAKISSLRCLNIAATSIDEAIFFMLRGGRKGKVLGKMLSDWYHAGYFPLTRRWPKMLHADYRCANLLTLCPVTGGFAGVAQLVEHLICNQRVGGSSPFASSR